MKINYDKKKFRVINNSENGDTSSETIFEYHQVGKLLTSEYSGGKILFGHLLATVNETGQIDMRYHHVNSDGEMMTGICQSRPEIQTNGKIRLYEKWQWTCADFSEGESILEEI